MGKRKQSDQKSFAGPGGAYAPRPSHGRVFERRGRAASEAAGSDATAARGCYWIYGRHSAAAALRNPRRTLNRLLATAEAEAEAAADIALAQARLGDRLVLTRADRRALAERFGSDVVHQGIAVEAMPLPPADLSSVIDTAGPEAAVLVLDHVTDPHNVGAILRSAAAFGAAAVIHTQHHSPPESGSLAKAAAGGLEQVPLIRVANLVQALAALKKAGFWCLGLAADGPERLIAVDLGGRIAVVLGAEGSGLRRLTREHCDLLVRLPTASSLAQLNVSNAAAIALYERARASKSEPNAG